MTIFRKQTEFEQSCKITLQEYLDSVECGGFIDYDGFGELATDTEFTAIEICPSEKHTKDSLPAWCTHIIWYNR